MTASFERRDVLRLIATGVAVASTGTLGACTDRGSATDPAPEFLARMMKAYRRAGGLTSPAALSSALGLPLDLAIGDVGVTRLRERIVADHRSGRTVELDGWLFAETEAQLAVLATLRPDFRNALEHPRQGG